MRPLLIIATAILFITNVQAADTRLNERYYVNYQLENAEYKGVVKKKGLFGKKSSFSISLTGDIEGTAILNLGDTYKNCEATYRFSPNIPYGPGRRAQEKRPIFVDLNFGGVSANCPYSVGIEFSKDFKKGKLKIAMDILETNSWDTLKVFKGSLSRESL